MKQFFGAFFGSIIGLVVAATIVVLIVVGVVTARFSEAMEDDRMEVVSENSVLRLDLDGKLTERESENPFADLKEATPFTNDEGDGLNMLLDKLSEAGDDSRIKGLYLCFRDLKAGLGAAQELRSAISDFRKKGKFVYAYGESFNETEYYIASVADKVFLNPQGMLEWKGLSMQLMFFRKTLEKLDVDVQIYREGKFKSAIEPFILDKMSDANREQSENFLGSMWSNMNAEVSQDRKVPVDELYAISNDLGAQFPEKTVGKLVTALAYEDEVITELKKKAGIGDTAKSHFIDIDGYDGKSETRAGEGRIAVIYANGAIAGGEGSEDEIGSDELARIIREARLNKKVKAIVLRVNSPGGSALASEVIWREAMLARKVKPFVVSMGDVAASGGYYISCAADRIFCQPNTITGSIGVFGMLPNIGRMLQNKFGITVDTVNTGRYSDVASGFRPATADESKFIQDNVEKVYKIFKQRVADGRNMSVETVDSIGQGRVWSGSDALRLGLVDEFGGLKKALAFAAKKAGMKDYRIMELPKMKNPLKALLGQAEKDIEERVMSSQLGGVYSYLRHMKTLMSLSGVQARLPFEFVAP